MSSGGGPNSEIAKLSIGIEATGAQSTISSLQEVENQAEQTAASIRKATSPGNMSAFYPIENPAQSMARHLAEDWDRTAKAAGSVFDKIDGVNRNMAAASNSARGFSQYLTTSVDATGNLIADLKESVRPLTQGVGLVNQFAGYTTLVVSGLWGAYEAFNALNERIDSANKGLRQAQNASLTFTQEMIYASEDVGAEKRLEQIDEEQNRFEDLQVAKARAGQQTFQQAQQVIDRVREEFAERRRVIKEQEEGDRNARIASLQAANDRKAYEDAQSRINAIRNEERLAGLKDEELVQAELENKRVEINKRIAAESRESVRESLYEELDATESLYAKKIELARTERLDRESKEQELRDKQEAAEKTRIEREALQKEKEQNRLIEAFNEAMGSAIKQNQEKIAQMFDATALLQRFDGIASALETLGRQRGIR